MISKKTFVLKYGTLHKDMPLSKIISKYNRIMSKFGIPPDDQEMLVDYDWTMDETLNENVIHFVLIDEEENRLVIRFDKTLPVMHIVELLRTVRREAFDVYTFFSQENDRNLHWNEKNVIEDGDEIYFKVENNRSSPLQFESLMKDQIEVAHDIEAFLSHPKHHKIITCHVDPHTNITRIRSYDLVPSNVVVDNPYKINRSTSCFSQMDRDDNYLLTSSRRFYKMHASTDSILFITFIDREGILTHGVYDVKSSYAQNWFFIFSFEQPNEVMYFDFSPDGKKMAVIYVDRPKVIVILKQHENSFIPMCEIDTSPLRNQIYSYGSSMTNEDEEERLTVVPYRFSHNNEFLVVMQCCKIYKLPQQIGDEVISYNDIVEPFEDSDEMVDMFISPSTNTLIVAILPTTNPDITWCNVYIYRYTIVDNIRFQLELLLNIPFHYNSLPLNSMDILCQLSSNGTVFSITVQELWNERNYELKVNTMTFDLANMNDESITCAYDKCTLDDYDDTVNVPSLDPHCTYQCLLYDTEDDNVHKNILFVRLQGNERPPTNLSINLGSDLYFYEHTFVHRELEDDDDDDYYDDDDSFIPAGLEDVVVFHPPHEIDPTYVGEVTDVEVETPRHPVTLYESNHFVANTVFTIGQAFPVLTTHSYQQMAEGVNIAVHRSEILLRALVFCNNVILRLNEIVVANNLPELYVESGARTITHELIQEGMIVAVCIVFETPQTGNNNPNDVGLFFQEETFVPLANPLDDDFEFEPETLRNMFYQHVSPHQRYPIGYFHIYKITQQESAKPRRPRQPFV